MKNTVYLLLFSFVLVSCGETAKDSLHKFNGPTMGTTYQIVYAGEEVPNLQAGVDSVLGVVNASLSTYIPTSTISIINQSAGGAPMDAMMRINFLKAAEVWLKTDGAFDPTVGPLVNAWGFGFKKMAEKVDSALIDSLKTFVGWEKLRISGDSLLKALPGVVVDFSALAKGFGVDEVGRYLESRGVANYIVEIGGELRAAGKKAPGFSWMAGIEKPVDDPTGNTKVLAYTLPLNDRSMATSGDYRNFYVENGQKFAHTIHPKSGYPAASNLLSASVVADDCMTADAFATACMVMGFEAAKALIEKEEGLEAVLIYSDASGALQQYVSPGLQKLVIEAK